MLSDTNSTSLGITTTASSGENYLTLEFLDSTGALLGQIVSEPTDDTFHSKGTLLIDYGGEEHGGIFAIRRDINSTDYSVYLDSAGNVGIGNSAPAGLFTVGNANQFVINNSGAITTATGITSSGTISFSGLSTSGVVTVTSGTLGSEAQLAIARGGTNSTATPTAGALAYGTGTAYGFSAAGTAGQLLTSNGTGAPTWVDSDSVGVNYWDRTGTLVTPEIITDNIATLGSIGIGNTNPAGALSVGPSSEFSVNDSGNITSINNISYSFPASQAAGGSYVLSNDGSGNLTWESVSGVGGINGSGSAGQITYFNGASTVTGSFDLFLDSSNSRLGIGTSAPTTALDIFNGNITLQR